MIIESYFIFLKKLELKEQIISLKEKKIYA
jgi:hypothetical protein